MTVLNNKIDFVALVSVSYANPNGDPLNGNRPRTDCENYGEISAECFKRKLRNRMQDLGQNIFVKMQERADDGYKSLKERYDADEDIQKLMKAKDRDLDAIKKLACEKWLDVRTFGNLFAYGTSTEAKKGKESGVSIGVRGPVSIHHIRSIDPVEVLTYQITKSVNGKTCEGNGKAADTMGSKHMVKYGLYKVKGSINVQLAQLTGFSEDDAELLKKCLITVFENDASSARPDGSMVVEKLYWAKHNCASGQYPAAKIHNAVKVALKEADSEPMSINDYKVELDKSEIPDVEIEEY